MGPEPFRKLALLGILAHVGCTNVGGVPRPAAVVPLPVALARLEADTSLFSAVVNGLLELTLPPNVAILRSALDSLPSITTTGPEHLVTLDPGQIVERERAIAQAQFRLTDNLDFPGCAGVFALGGDKSGCPASPEARIAIALPRAGGAYYPNSIVDRRSEGIASGHVSVRVIVVRASRSGTSATAMDFVFRPDGLGWKAVERVELAYRH